MIALPALLVGKSLGETVFRCLLAVAGVLLAGWLLWTLGTSRYHAWQAGRWKERAVEAAQAAKLAELNALRANQGAQNATKTREAIDAGTVTVRVETEQSVERMERHVPTDRGPAAEPDPRLMRELEDAERAVRAAQGRLRRADTR